jgi:hypothetical protein
LLAIDHSGNVSGHFINGILGPWMRTGAFKKKTATRAIYLHMLVGKMQDGRANAKQKM